MKTLKQHTLIYDKDCPLCRIYTKAFIRCGMMDQQGRLPFHEIKNKRFVLLDANRARNEIALVNTQTQQVTYGLDSLLTIIGHSFPTLTRIAHFPPLYYVLKQLYAFISYNRKQIIPHREVRKEAACVPDFRLSYRIAYILFVTLLSIIVLANFGQKLGSFLPQHHHIWRESIICLGQIGWQTLWLKRKLGHLYADYIGNMMTVSLIGTLLLIPALLLPLSSLAALVYFAVVVSLMLAEHYRRCKILDIGLLPSLSWIIYRMVVLGIIFIIG